MQERVEVSLVVGKYSLFRQLRKLHTLPGGIFGAGLQETAFLAGNQLYDWQTDSRGCGGGGQMLGNDS